MGWRKIRKIADRFRLTTKSSKKVRCGKGFMEAENPYKMPFRLGGAANAPKKLPGVLLNKVKQEGFVETEEGTKIKFDVGNELIRAEYKDGTMVLYTLEGVKSGG